jgi:PAS domain S-box-containing protein
MTNKAISEKIPTDELNVLRLRVAELEKQLAKRIVNPKTTPFEDGGIYKAIFESANDSILFIDKKGEIVDFNDRLLEISGYQRDELIGKSIRTMARMVTPKSLATIVSNFVKRMAGFHVSPYEVDMVKNNGELLSVEINARPLKNGNKVIGDLVILRNISERKQGEKALRESEDKYRLIVENSRDIILTLNLAGNLTYVSPSVTKAFGYNPSDVIGLSFSSLAHPEDVAALEDVIQRDFKFGYQTPSGLEFRIRHRSGEWRWCNGKGTVLRDADGAFLNFIGIVSDITEHKQIEEALKESESKYRNVVELAKDGICIVRNRIVKYCNPQLAEMWGGTIQEIQDTPFTNYLHPDAFSTMVERYEKRIKGEPGPHRYETTLKNKDGDKIYVEVNVANINYLGQDAEIAIIHDITEHKRALEAVQESEQNLRHFLDNASVGVRIRDENEQVLYINQAYLEIFGYDSIEEAKSTTPMKHYTQKSYAEYVQRAAKIARGELVSNKVEVDIKRKDGTIRHIQVMGQRVIRNGHTQGHTFYNDITAIKQAEDALKASEQNFRNSLDSSLIGIRIVDKSWHTLYANKVFLDIFGYKCIDEIGVVNPKEIYTTEEYKRFSERHDKRIRGEQVSDDIEMEIIRKDGAIRWVQSSRTEVLWNGQSQYQLLCVDITERKQAQEILNASEQNLHNAMDKLPMGCRITDIDDNTLYSNQAFLNIFGYDSAEEIRTKPPVKDFYTPESYADYLVRKDKMLRGEQCPDPVEVDIIRRDGTLRHLQLFHGNLIWNGKQEFQTIYNDVTERKQADEALRLSEQNYRNSMDKSSIGIRISDKTGNNLYANQAMLRIFGYKDIDEIQTKPPQEFYTAESHAAWVVRHQQLLRGEPMPKQIETKIQRQDGTIRTLQVSMIDVFWDGQHRHQTLYHDVTEQKNIEMALRESEEKYRTIFESANDIIILLNTAGIVLDVNARLTDIGGYERHELIGKKISELTNIINKENMAKVAASFVRTLISSEVISYQVEMLKRNREPIYLEINSVPIKKDDKVVGALAILRDITEKTKTELQIKEQKALTDRILEGTPDIIAVVGKNRQIIMINKAFEHNFNISEEQAKGKEIGEIVRVPVFIDTMTRVLESGKSQYQIEFRCKKGAVEMVLIADIINTQQNEVMAILHDITEEREMQERLYLTDRLASVGEMAAGIAHELNNPLTGVVALSQLLLENGVPPELKDDLQAISNEGQRAASVVKNMLSFARNHTSTAESIEINAIISQVLNLRAYEHRVNNIEVITHFAANLPGIVADHFQLQQVFINIVLNAEQSMIESHGQGKLTITTERIKGIIRVSFSDDGPGIPPDVINRIFDPFFTTKEVGKGTGLGLSICYGIITTQGGRIYAKSLPGKGATFIIELPINPQ